MKLVVIAAAVLSLAATTASAAVVISQEQVVANPAGERKSEQTVIISGHKRKIINGDAVILTDLDAGATYFMRTAAKQVMRISLPPSGMFQKLMLRDGSSVAFKRTDATDKVAGYDCRNYEGSAQITHSSLAVTECVAKDAPGAREFVEFQNAMQQKLKGTSLASPGETPDGIPVSSKTVATPLPFVPPPGFPEAQAARLKALTTHLKPTSTTVTVTKIEVKDFPPDTFVVPADYKQGGMGSLVATSPAHPNLPGASSPPAASAP